ncbi:hypothetical protein Taro_052960 [Colocasia esculenta]|uniref:Uncharacterized protein n=1 Tax=Colocasia esculenta TaxID=4460 RepID=A0A843XLR2_COLES|nr:hypothetical protein [Colocasia esculenta]
MSRLEVHRHQLSRRQIRQAYHFHPHHHLSVPTCGGRQYYAHSSGMELLRSMSVLEYEARFSELSKYAPHIVADERRKVKKSVMGLKPSSRTRLVAFGHHSMDEALPAACMQEAEMEVYLEEKRASLKRPGSAFQRQDKRKKTPVFPPKAVVPARVAVPTTSSGIVAEKPLCSHCGKRHGGDVCWVTSGRCLTFGNKNHKIRDCLKMAQQTAAAAVPAVAKPAPRAVGRPRAQTRVFALARDEAELAEHITEGTMLTGQCFSSFHVCIEERVLHGNFYLLKMKDYDAILGLDWLEEHYALMDCNLDVEQGL